MPFRGRITSMGKKILLTGAALLCLCSNASYAQRIALKTNMLYLATLTPNIELETRIAPKFTSSISIAGNFYKYKENYEPGFLLIEPEIRYWFERPMARHFLGIAGLYGDYNVKWGDMRHDGDAIGAGLTYGYDFVIGRRWNIELSLAAGMAHIRDIKYNVQETPVAPTEPNDKGWKPAVLRAGITLSYILK